MELIHGTDKKASNFSPEDIISSMPDDVITNIMNRLPLEEAVRTSILSRNWTFKWALLRQLIFDDEFVEFSDMRDVISKLLLHLRGAITKFYLHIPGDTDLVVEDINRCYLLLSRIGIKEFTLISEFESPLELPTHLFSSLNLEHLKLCGCSFHPPPSFRGFPNLLSLHLYAMNFENYTFGELVGSCPLIEILIIYDNYHEAQFQVTLADIAKLGNLKKLSLPLCFLDNTEMIRSSNVVQHTSLLSKLEELDLFYGSNHTEADVRKWVPTSFPCLKTLGLHSVNLGCDSILPYVYKMIWGFPNLQTLNIVSAYNPPHAKASSKVEGRAMGPLQLQNIVLVSIKDLENEVCLIKSLLACSPLLKKMDIYPSLSQGSDERFMFARKLLRFNRAFTADIELYPDLNSYYFGNAESRY